MPRKSSSCGCTHPRLAKQGRFRVVIYLADGRVSRTSFRGKLEGAVAAARARARAHRQPARVMLFDRSNNRWEEDLA